MWKVKNVGHTPIYSPITKVRFLPGKSINFDVSQLPADVQRMVDTGMLDAVRVGSSAKVQLEIEKELHEIADEIFLDWYI